MKTICLASMLIAMSLLGSCGNTGGEAVPRPRAYPRTSLYASTSYSSPDGLPVNLELNDSVSHTIERRGENVWVNVDYNRYGLTLHITISQPADSAAMAEVVDNRLERMSLNSGGAPAEVTQLISSGGYSSQLFITQANPTPLQFIAVGPGASAKVVSGTLAFNEMPQSLEPDSIAPIIDAVKSDLIHTLQNLR